MFKDGVWNAKQRSGLQGDRGAWGGTGGPGALGLLARHNFQCAATVMTRIIHFTACEVTATILSNEGLKTLFVKRALTMPFTWSVNSAHRYTQFTFSLLWRLSVWDMYSTYSWDVINTTSINTDPLCLMFLRGGCMQRSCVRRQTLI